MIARCAINAAKMRGLCRPGHTGIRGLSRYWGPEKIDNFADNGIRAQFHVALVRNVNHTSLGLAAGEQAGVLMPFWTLVVAPRFEPVVAADGLRATAPQGSSLAGVVSGVVNEKTDDKVLLPLKPPHTCRT